MTLGSTPGRPSDRAATRRVLLLSMYYAPEPSGNAPYVADLAQHLMSSGWRVVVLAGVPHYPRWRRFPEDETVLRSTAVVDGVEVKRHRHYVPTRPTALKRLPYEASFYLNVRMSAVPSADAVLSIVPSLSDAALARPVARAAGCSYGLMFQDLVGRGAVESGVPGGRFAGSFAKTVECRAIRDASAIGIATEGFRDYVVACGAEDDQIEVVPNWSHLPAPPRSAAEVRAEVGWHDRTVVLHGGNLGYKQGLEHVISAAAQAVEGHPELLFVFVGDGSRKPELAGAAAGLPNVRFLEPQPPERYAELLAAADMLLLHEAPGVSHMSLPSKLTSYLSAARPVVAAVDPGGITAAEISRAEVAICVPPGDPRALIGAVVRLARDPDAARSMTQRGEEFARRYLDRNHSLALAERLVGKIAGAPTKRRGR